MTTLSKLALAVLAASAKAITGICDLWAQPSGPILTNTVPFKTINPLNGTRFNSTNPSNPVSSATIYFNTTGLFDLGCPHPFVAYRDNTTLSCTEYNVTAEQFSADSATIATQLKDVSPLAEYGHATYTPGGNCTSSSIGSFVFLVQRGIAASSTMQPAL